MNDLIIQSMAAAHNAFDEFYHISFFLLDTFYPNKSVTLSNRDPIFVTPEIKLLLRKRNSLMHRGRIEKANSLTENIRKKIIKNNSLTLKAIPRCSKEMWEAVKKITGKSNNSSVHPVSNFSSEQLNQHYASISNDAGFIQPVSKVTCNNHFSLVGVSEIDIFKILDTLKRTSAGLDGVPSWFLRIAAPGFSKPIAHLFNLSIANSFVPDIWKNSIITPVQKQSKPPKCEDFRPISVTPILSRILEKIVVRNYIYPNFDKVENSQLFSDQFAFRPSGSTTAALISILHCISKLLLEHTHVFVISLDFSKAFDRVRHVSLAKKLAILDLPDSVFNWLLEYLSGRGHRTKFGCQISELLGINSSIDQGSGIGPSCYVVNSADLQPIDKNNFFFKYADDTYLLVAANNAGTIAAELDNVSVWVDRNNLVLN